MSEGSRHYRLCALLYALLREACGPDNTAGADQFLYFDASDPRRCCAPDGYVKLGVPEPEDIRSWKTWERGAPELCIEILSPSDTKEKLTLQEKLRRFHRIGVSEVVVFDVEAERGARLRAWDLIEGDLVERVVDNEATPCLTLDLWFVIAPAHEERLAAALRLARDPEGASLLPTASERAAVLAREAAEAEARAARTSAESAKAEAKIAQLERELARLRGG